MLCGYKTLDSVKFVNIHAEADGALDKARKHKKRQLEDTLNLVIKKRKVIPVFSSNRIVFLLLFCVYPYKLGFMT